MYLIKPFSSQQSSSWMHLQQNIWTGMQCCSLIWLILNQHFSNKQISELTVRSVFSYLLVVYTEVLFWGTGVLIFIYLYEMMKCPSLHFFFFFFFNWGICIQENYTTLRKGTGVHSSWKRSISSITDLASSSTHLLQEGFKTVFCKRKYTVLYWTEAELIYSNLVFIWRCFLGNCS